MESREEMDGDLCENEVEKKENDGAKRHEMENAFRIKISTMCCHIILIEALNVHKLRKRSVNNEHQKSQ